MWIPQLFLVFSTLVTCVIGPEGISPSVRKVKAQPSGRPPWYVDVATGRGGF